MTIAAAGGSVAVLPHSPAPILPVAAATGLLFSCLLITVNRTAPDPYMDEIFHISQAQKYCEGRFGAMWSGLYVHVLLG